MSSSPKNEHVETYHDEEYLKCGSTDGETTCNICMAEFIDPMDLQMHFQQVHNVSSAGKRCCDFCPSSYTDLMSYAVHIRDNHILSMITCKYCFKVFTDNDNHRKHEKKHLVKFNKRIYSCSQCFETFGIVKELRNHENLLHNNIQDGVSILDCLPFLSVALNIKATTFLECLGSSMVYICVGCEYTTDKANIFIQHGQRGKCKTYVCNNCSNTYKNKKNLYRHLIQECVKGSKYADKLVKCPECKVDFYQSDFKFHKKTCNIIQCTICNTLFGSMYELSKHQAKEHPLSINLVSCQFCWKQSVGSVALQKHIDRSHRGEFPLYKYLCIHCQSMFKHPKRLFAHYFTNHKDLNPYKCKICDMEFRIRKKFTIHIKMKHNSQGFVEFDESYHVFFTDKKSENPFVPKSLIVDDDQNAEETDEKEKDGNTEFIYTETEGNQTEAETKVKTKRKNQRTRARKVNKSGNLETVCIESSDDEPLLLVKKRVQTQKKTVSKQQQTQINKSKFTCNVCKKYCYTFQNYNHHMSLHSNERKKCIKCPKVFRSKSKLSQHIARYHSTSKLTETLKDLLEKRKNGVAPSDDVSMSEKFKKTIKKVVIEEQVAAAKIVPAENGLSVQKFIENFSPEETKTEPFIENEVTMKLVTGFYKKPAISMIKLDPKPINYTGRLSMPIKFKETKTEKVNVTIKLVPTPTNYEEIEDNNNYNNNHDDDGVDHREEEIPEVAEEVMLEVTDELLVEKPEPPKIIIDKLPKEYKNMRIAHMLPQAPYYKIVKVNDIVDTEKEKKPAPAEALHLPDGTKLVTTNPLAHLLGDTPVEKFLEPLKNKYYKPKVKNFQGILANALMKLDQPTPPRKKKKKEVTCDE